MSLLRVSSVSFSYSGGEPLFADASFSINPGDRIAIVGPNGAGKSTLLRLLIGELAPAGGEIVRRNPLRLAVADQELSRGPSTLFDFVFDAYGPLAVVRAEMRALEARLAEPECACDYAGSVHDYEEAGGFAAEAAVARILGGLGWTEEEFGREVRTLSGGEQTRAGLARALAADADLLILDEPTNHLDIRAREWLEGHLRKRQGATALTSHDRRLLGEFATRVVEMERGRVRVFEGGYEEYRRARGLLDRQAWDAYHSFERRKAAVEQAAERRQNLAKKVASTPEGSAGVRNPFYAAKSARVARTARILKERVGEESKVEKPWEEQAIDGLTFEGVERSGDVVLSVRALTKAHGPRVLFAGLEFDLKRGERLVVRGGNGTGKSTLLRLIQGLETPDAGTIRLGAKVRMACVEQLPRDFDLERTALEICGTGTSARTLLGCLKLRAERWNRPLGELSGGERTKVALAHVLNSGANLLLLDEPTNHWEIEAQEALEEALRRYPGTLVLASHDRAFLEGVAGEARELVIRSGG